MATCALPATEKKELRTFQTLGFTVTPSNNIVVADISHDALHVMNSKGDLLGLQLVFQDFGITRPYSSCFENQGYLLIGCAILRITDKYVSLKCRQSSLIFTK